MVTVHDVAARAGVSIATVSRVLTGRTGVSEQKRGLVLKACEELGYQPDSVAASLRMGVTRSVGIVIPDITNPFFPAVVQSAEMELSAGARDVMFCDSNNDVQVEAVRIRTLLRRRVDALLFCPVHTEGSIASLRIAAKSTHVLQLDRLALDELDFVGVDHRAGMRQIANHLSELKVGRAAFIGKVRSMSTLVDRSNSFRQAAKRKGIDTVEIELDFLDVSHGRLATRTLIEQGTVPEALVCANDEVAAGAILELAQAKIRVPEDVVVTGYDDVPIAEILGLTTIRQPLTELGEAAARLVNVKSSEPRHIRLVPELIVRTTTTSP